MERLIFLFNDLLQQVPTQPIEQTTEEIKAFLQESNIIEILLEIATTQENPNIRRSAYVYLRKVVCAIKDNEQRMALKDPFLSLFTTETDKTLFNQLIYLLEPVAKAVNEESEFPELTQLGLRLIENEETVEQGLFLFDNLYEYLPIDDQEAHRESLAQFCAAHFSSDNKDVRILAYDLWTELAFTIVEDGEEDIDELLLQKMPTTLESINSMFETSVAHLDQKEIAMCVENLLGFFYDRYSCTQPVALQIFQQVLELLGREDIPISIRFILLHLLDDGPDFYQDFFTENTQAYLEAALQLSLEACNSEQRQGTEYLLASTFLSNLAGLNSQNEEFFPYVMQTISGLVESQDEASIQVAIQFLSWIVPNCADDIIESPDDVLSLVSEGLSSEDDYIAQSSATLLEELISKAASAIAPHFDDLVSLLLERASNDTYLVALERILYKGDKCYSRLDELLQFLIGLLSDESFEFKENVIGCITGSLSKFTGTNETFFESIYPLLAPLLEDLSNIQLIKSIFACIGVLVKVSPASTHGSLESILPFIIQVISSEEINISACAAVVDTLKEIISMFSVSIESESQAIATNLLRLMEIANPREDDDKEDDNAEYLEADEESPNDLAEREYLSMRQNAIVSLGMMIEVMHENISDLIPQIVEKMIDMIQSGVIVDQMSAAVAMRHSIPVIYQFGFDPNTFLKTSDDTTQDRGLITLITTEISENACAQLIRLLTSIISSLIPDFTIAYIDLIGTFLMNAVSGQLYITKDLASKEDTILPSLFECLNRFILLVGDHFQQFIESGFVDQMLAHLDGKSRIMKGYAIRTLSTVTIHFPDPNILGPVIEQALIGITMSNVSLKTNSFNAIGFLIRGSRESLQPHIQDIIEAANDALKNQGSSEELYESALSAWCTVYVIYSIPVTAEQVNTAFARLQFRTQNISRASDHIVAFSKFIFYAVNAGVTGIESVVTLVSAIALSSTDFEIARIGQPQCQLFASILSQQSDSIEELTCMNQRKARIILSRLQ